MVGSALSLVHLKKLAFGQFDTLSEAVNVLSMDVGDRALAEAWAGQFVPRTVKMQVSSLLQALSTGNLYEMRAATSVLLTMGERVPKELNGRLRELAWAVSVAASRKFAKAILEWSRSPLLKVLEPGAQTDQIAALSAAAPPRNGKTSPRGLLRHPGCHQADGKNAR